ncbi:hypothetical protein Vretifemale_17142, partial [Volvox reticuliferus]
QAFAKERWLGSWNFLKLQRQDEGGQAYLPAAAPAQMPAPYSALANSGECIIVAKAVTVAECVQLPAEDDGGLQMRAATAALLQGRVTADKEDEKVRREAAEAAAAELRTALAEEGARRGAAEAAAAELQAVVVEQGARHEAAEASTAELRAALAEQGARCEAAEAAAAELRAVLAEE